MDLQGKIALVTGGATGIGLDHVKKLLDIGVKHVAVLDINQSAGSAAAKQLNEKYGTERTIFINCDVTKKQDLEAAFKKTTEAFKRLDIVVNNAGIMRDTVWETEIALNFTALVRSTFLALDYMGKDKGGAGGAVVNIASIVGLYPISIFSVYAGTKSAAIAFSQSMGVPFHEERTGVRVLTLCPGVTDTPLISESEHHVMHPDWAEEHLRMLKLLPPQKTESVANALVDVLKNAKSGSVWVAEGGKPVYEISLPHYETLKV